ncbi:MAG: hypothetical protein ACYDEQ_14610 [Desulfocucumaceae bacterium]
MTTSVLQALYNFECFPSGMFLFRPCLNIYEKGQNNPFTDLDLVVITNGKFIIGEVKSSPEGFKPDDFSKLKIVAENIMPDIVVFAASGNLWPNNVEIEILKLKDEMTKIGIEVLPILLRW